MCPIASELLAEAVARGGGRHHPAAAALLLCLCLGFPPRVAPCPPYCLCASDIISCSGCNLSALPFDLPGYATRLDLSHNALAELPADWISQPFERLTTLILSRNAISQIGVNAFAATPHLLHLDLSSNRLSVLNSAVFAGMKELKELLLFGNQIAQINPGAFSELRGLSKLYLSGNRLTALPLDLYTDPRGPLNLTFLDLSSNRITGVSVHTLLSLTRQSGVYLQENPLVCDCALLALLEYWTWRQYRPLVDFKGEYPCRDTAGPKPNCSQGGVSDLPLKAPIYQSEPGKSLWLPCPGLSPPIQKGSPVFWITPRTVLDSSEDGGGRLVVLANGTLEIREAEFEDAGAHVCVTARGHQLNTQGSLEVNVVVGNLSAASTSGLTHRSGAEHFNTAFTTLASCVVSIILVLLYLYLTPCRCREGRGGASRGCGGRAFILCSDPREVESGQRRSNGKRVAFLEPQAEDSETAGAKTPAMNLGHVTTEGILKNGSRTVGQTLTDPANIA